MVDRTVIVGAGPAGLTAAYELGRLNRPGVVLEKDETVGGISRTVVHNGYRFDIGGHRFFTRIPAVRNLWSEWLADDLLERRRMSRIFYDGKFFDYPLRHIDTLRTLGPVEATRIVTSYLRSRLASSGNEVSFEDWVVNRFGRRLYEIFFKSYTEKVWGIPCDQIASEWAAQRIKNLDLAAAIRNALTGLRSRNGQIIASLIDQFSYPRLGPGMMWNRCCERSAEMGVPTHTGVEVTRVLHRHGLVSAVVAESAAGQEEFAGSSIISSMPITHLIRMLDPPPPEEVIEAANRLRYRDFITVVLIIDRGEVFPDNWIYIHSPQVKMGRVQNFKNWSPEMVPDGSTTSLGLEYFVQEGDELWTSSDDQLRELGTRELAQLGMIEPDEVVDAVVMRVRGAYPLYDAHYREALEVIRAYISGFENLATIGRNGQHRYNNQDHSMMTGLLAARNVAGEAHDVWSVNVDLVYSEDNLQPLATEDRLAVSAATHPPHEELVVRAFARYDSIALGAAISAVAGTGLFVATVALLLRGGDPVGPTLSLLGNYLLGFQVSWGGAVLGFFEAAAVGFLFGFGLARTINLVVGLTAEWFVREYELEGIVDPFPSKPD